MSKDKSYSLAFIAELTDSKIVGNEDFIVDNLSTLDNATKSSISFLANSKYKKNLKKSKSIAIITSAKKKIKKETEM